MQHEGLDCCYRSKTVRLSLMSALLLEAPLTRCFIGEVGIMYPTTCHDTGQTQVNHWAVTLGKIVPIYRTPVHISLFPPIM